MPYGFGDICLIRFPFTDGISAKKRPALLLSTDADGDGVFLRVTTQLDGDASLIIGNWRECGLLAPSCIRVNKIATLSLNLVDRHLGRLSELDTSALLISLEAWLKQLAKE
jgi:mRNA interferase MazF